MTREQFVKQIYQLEDIRFPSPIIIWGECLNLIGFGLFQGLAPIANDFAFEPNENPGMK